ncbi:MAG: histidine phosphatase family protein [Bacteroidetes bacterium]|nr:histidine phosphatase family protein [Bacteroidota bacterium]
MDLYIIRHGETEFNNKGVIQGRRIDSPLNDTGSAQSQAFYKCYKETPFDMVFHSSLQRSKQTVMPFIDGGCKATEHKGLDEIDWGSSDGLSTGNGLLNDFYRVLRSWKKGDIMAKLKGGENPLEVQARLQLFVDQLSKSSYESVLICTHGRAMRILLCTLLGKELTEMDRFPHQNLTLYKIRMDKETGSVVIFNNIDHLNGRN